jgi:hypothetical protein
VRRANWLLLSFCFRGLAQPLIVGDAKTKGKRACLEDAEEYSLVSKLATDLQKQELLAKLSNQPRVMALEVDVRSGNNNNSRSHQTHCAISWFAAANSSDILWKAFKE